MVINSIGDSAMAAALHQHEHLHGGHLILPSQTGSLSSSHHHTFTLSYPQSHLHTLTLLRRKHTQSLRVRVNGDKGEGKGHPSDVWLGVVARGTMDTYMQGIIWLD